MRCLYNEWKSQNEKYIKIISSYPQNHVICFLLTPVINTSLIKRLHFFMKTLNVGNYHLSLR